MSAPWLGWKRLTATMMTTLMCGAPQAVSSFVKRNHALASDVETLRTTLRDRQMQLRLAQIHSKRRPLPLELCVACSGLPTRKNPCSQC